MRISKITAFVVIILAAFSAVSVMMFNVRHTPSPNPDFGAQVVVCSEAPKPDPTPEPEQKRQLPLNTDFAELPPDVVLRKVRTDPPFMVALLSGRVDTDYSYGIHECGVWEKGITSIFHHVLEKAAVALGQTPCLVVDVGGHFGYYSSYSASFGCRVLSFEPVPAFGKLLGATVLMNDHKGLVEVVPKIVSDTVTTIKLGVHRDGCMGCSGVGAGGEQISVDSAVLDDIVPSWVSRTLSKQVSHAQGRSSSEFFEDNSVITLLKVDVEGHEPKVLKGAAQMLSTGKVANLVMEVNPNKPGNHEPCKEMLTFLWDLQMFEFYHIDWPLAKPDCKWTDPLDFTVNSTTFPKLDSHQALLGMCEVIGNTNIWATSQKVW